MARRPSSPDGCSWRRSVTPRPSLEIAVCATGKGSKSFARRTEAWRAGCSRLGSVWGYTVPGAADDRSETAVFSLPVCRRHRDEGAAARGGSPVLATTEGCCQENLGSRFPRRQRDPEGTLREALSNPVISPLLLPTGLGTGLAREIRARRAARPLPGNGARRGSRKFWVETKRGWHWTTYRRLAPAARDWPISSCR